MRSDVANLPPDHPFRAVDSLGLLEPFHDAEPLEGFRLSLLGCLLEHLLAEFLCEGIHIDFLQQLVNGFRSHFCPELVRIIIRQVLVFRHTVDKVEVLFLRKKLHLFPSSVARVDYDIFLVVYHGLELLGCKPEHGRNLVGS